MTHLPPALLATAAGEHSAADLLLRPDPGLWLWTLLVFLGVLFILWKWGWGMMLDALDRRDQSIRGSIEEARREREEAERLLAEHRALLEKTRRETAEMLATAQQEAAKERQRIVDEARAEYEKILARGREQVAQEAARARAELRREVADLVLLAASRLLRRTMDDAEHRRLAEEFVAELERYRGGDLPRA